MDSFESVVATILERDGYWVRSGFKVELTKEEKQRIGRHSSPRWELDLVAYKASANEILVVECKSYLDSRGVKFQDVVGKGKGAKRYKLFNDRDLREVVFARLKMQLLEAGACAADPTVRLCLAAGKIATEPDRGAIEKHFTGLGWQLWDAQWLRAALTRVADGGYDNQVAAVVAKLLIRK
jgi:hypothetical protein